VGGLSIEIDRVAGGRLTFALASGTAERNRPAVPPAPDLKGALIAWGLGHRTRGHRTGLTIEADVVVPLDRSYASLILDGGKPKLVPPSEPQTERAGLEIVQLPVLARDGALTPHARELGGKRARAALCFDEAGNMYVARMTHDTPAPLGQTLLELGCELVVELDRGSHPPPLVERAGTESPPHAGYEQTMLYGIEAPMEPQTHRF
jgi:hypothetical protein